VEPDAIWLVAAAISFALLCGIALWRNRASATGDPHALRQLSPNKIERIRAHRKETGVGLKEALLAIEAQDRGQPLPEPAPASPLAPDIHALVQRGQVIDAIKLYREQTGASLVEAKQAIDRLRTAK
jgi:ribosomal protein L7/L12